MNIVFKLPLTRKEYDGIWIVVDQFTKSLYFLLVRETFLLQKLAKIFANEIVNMHEVSMLIVLDRDAHFTSRFW